MRLAASSLLVVLALCVASLAHAEPRLSGAVDARGWIGFEQRHGASLGVDLWGLSGPLRVGGTFGVGALSQHGRVSSRVYTPAGLSLALVPPDDRSGLNLVVRGGVYAGAKKGGLIAGPFASGALGYRLALGEGASLRLGVDFWALFQHDTALLLGPYVGLGF